MREWPHSPVPRRVAHTSFYDVCALLAIGLERTGGLGTSLRSVVIAYMPNGCIYTPPAERQRRRTPSTIARRRFSPSRHLIFMRGS